MFGTENLSIFESYRSQVMSESQDYIQEVVVLDVLDPGCVYTFICVEIKTNTKTVTLRMFQKGVDDTGDTDPIFKFLSWRSSDRGIHKSDFFLRLVLHFLAYLLLPTL